jgi:hypothetical protein
MIQRKTPQEIHDRYQDCYRKLVASGQTEYEAFLDKPAEPHVDKTPYVTRKRLMALLRYAKKFDRVYIRAEHNNSVGGHHVREYEGKLTRFKAFQAGGIGTARIIFQLNNDPWWHEEWFDGYWYFTGFGRIQQEYGPTSYFELKCLGKKS